MDWTNGNYVPDEEGDYLCEVIGVPFAKYLVCRWDGMGWWVWIYFNMFGQDHTGWCALKPEWSIVRWTEIEEFCWTGIEE
jgi:hypothetical protein